jgi:hypothetical protein
MKTILLPVVLCVAVSSQAAKWADCAAQCETLAGMPPVLVAVFFWPSDGFSLDRRNEIAYAARNAVLAMFRDSRIPIRQDLTGPTPHLLIWVQFSGRAYSIQSFVVEDVKLPRFAVSVPVHTWETSRVGYMPKPSKPAIVAAVLEQARVFASDYRIGNSEATP